MLGGTLPVCVMVALACGIATTMSNTAPHSARQRFHAHFIPSLEVLAISIYRAMPVA
jgi:hypothetical protein